MIKNLIFTFLAALTFGAGQAQTVTTTTVVSSANNAVDIAKAGVDPSLRERIVSVYGVGTPAAIQTWWVIFYDPSVPSHGRVVKVAYLWDHENEAAAYQLLDRKICSPLNEVILNWQNC